MSATLDQGPDHVATVKQVAAIGVGLQPGLLHPPLEMVGVDLALPEGHVPQTRAQRVGVDTLVGHLVDAAEDRFVGQRFAAFVKRRVDAHDVGRVVVVPQSKGGLGGSRRAAAGS